MKLTELRPCDNCNGPLKGGLFYIVRFSLAIIKREAVNEFFGMHQFFGGRAPTALVENFAPAAADAVTIAMDDDEFKQLMNELFVCNDCYMTPLDLPLLAERRASKERRELEAT